MATITTYLLVSGPAEPEGVAEHDLFEEYDFARREAEASDTEQLPTLTFALQRPLEEAVDLGEAIRRFSADVPEASVVLCEVEERFDQVEWLQMIVFRNGKRGGDLEHGYIYNVGPGQ